MKTLIDNLVSIVRSAITSGYISANSVFKGFGGLESIVPEMVTPYIAIDDGGERVEDITNDTQKRVYSVVFEIGVFLMDEEAALDSVLDISSELKAEIEKETNRQKDGHTWGVDIVPFGSNEDNSNFFRARKIVVEFNELEDRDYSPY